MPRRLQALALAGLLGGLVLACSDKREIVIFHAPSLSRVMSELGDAFTSEQPQYRLRLEVSGSQVAARKLTELNLLADVVAVSDVEVIDRMLIPTYADWSLLFATNELVLAHAAHSRYTEEVTTENWPEILTRPDVRLGLANPDTSPLGYRTLIAWQLAESVDHRAGLAYALRARVPNENLMTDEAELWALLSSRAVDYVFLYRSTAEDHRLKLTRLPASINLSQPGESTHYATASVPVVFKHDQPATRIHGAPIWYGVTVPRLAPHAEGGRAFVGFLLSDAGRRALTRAGFRPLAPAQSAQWAALPDDLKALSARRTPE